MMKYKFFKCECSAEVVMVESDGEYYYVSLFNNYYHDGKISLIDRVKYMVKILFTGKIYSDQIVMNRQEAKSLTNFLLDTGTDLTSVDTYTVDEYNMQHEEGK